MAPESSQLLTQSLGGQRTTNAMDPPTILADESITKSEITTPTSRPHSHFQNLPADLLYYIFILCHQADSKAFGTTASHVCRVWRVCALGIPILWSRLMFGSTRPWLGKNHTWVQRSGHIPLEIDISPSPFWKNYGKILRTIMKIVLRQAHRWKKLSIYIPREKTARFLLEQLSSVNAPLLEELSVHGSTEIRKDLKFKCRPFQNGTPELRSLVIKTFQFDWLSTPQPKLEVIRLTLAHPLPRSSPSQILTTYPTLRHLTVNPHAYFYPSTIHSTTPNSKIIHLSLHCLQVPVDLLDEILAVAELPALGHLHLPNLFKPSPETIVLLQQHSPRLERLTIGSGSGRSSGTEDNLRKILPSFHPVRSLREVVFGGIQFRQPHLPIGTAVPPSVQDIIIRGCDGLLEEDFRPLVESRMGADGVKPLKHLQVDDLTVDVSEG